MADSANAMAVDRLDLGTSEAETTARAHAFGGSTIPYSGRQEIHHHGAHSRDDLDGQNCFGILVTALFKEPYTIAPESPPLHTAHCLKTSVLEGVRRYSRECIGPPYGPSLPERSGKYSMQGTRMRPRLTVSAP